MTEHSLALRGPLTPDQIAERMSSGHSVFSPSASEMTMTCEESLVLNVLAEDVQTYEAAEGTVAHALGEEWLKDGDRPDKWIGYVEDVRGFEIEITEEMLGFVQDYVDECDSIKLEYEQSFVEMYVDISHLTPIPEQGGTGDFVGLKWGKAVLVDLKYGKDPVFAYYPDTGPNKQLMVYVSGVFREWDWLYNFQEFELVIVQPRLPGGLTRHTVTREELRAFEDKARRSWLRSWSPEPTRTPSLKGCRWCKVRTKCPALYLFMSDDIEDAFEEHPGVEAKDMVIEATYTVQEMRAANGTILDDMAVSPFPKLPDPPELSTAALAKLLRYRKLMETFFNAIHAELLTRAISDEEDIPWWKLVESRTLRKFVDDEEWIVQQLEGKGLKKSDLYEKKMLSPAKMERLLHTKLKMKLTEAKRFLEESGLTVKPPGQKTLAAISDKREALAKDGDVFDVWESDEDI